MNERDLDYFAAVARHGHLGRAAESLGLSQPALSTSLRRLEKSMQAKLVKRTPKGVELTALGSALLARLGRLQLARKDVMREMADLSQGRAGELGVAAQPGTPEELVATAGAALLKDASRITLKVTVSTFDVMVPALLNGELDLLVGSIPSASSGDFTHEYLMRDEYIVYTSVGHRLAARKRVTLEDLAEELWVKTGGPSWASLNRAFEQAGLPPPRFAVESNSELVRHRAVTAGGMLAIGGRRRLQHASRQFRLLELPVRDLSAPRDVVASYRTDSYLSPAARRLIETLKSTARELSKAR